MPLITALDEYDSALTKVAIHAEIGLENPAYQETALRLILALCHQTDETVGDVLSIAVAQTACALSAPR